MENKAHALVAGLFTLVLAAALVGAVLWIRAEPIAQDVYTLHTKGSISGLNVQARVRYRGVEVGKVESIKFDPQDSRIILVGIGVHSGTPLTLGTYGQLAAQGITGLSYVQLNDDGSSAQLRDPADPVQARIELRPSFLERMSSSGEQLIVRLGELAERMDAWLSEENKTQVFRTLAAIEAVAAAASKVSASVESAAQSLPPLAQQAGATMRNADVLMAELRTLADNLGTRAQALDRVAASAERIGAAVDEISASGSTLALAVSHETLPRLNLALDELRRSSRSLERLIEELNANPSSLVFGKSAPAPGPGEPGFVHGAAP